MINVICPKCGGGRDLPFTENDEFKWQCQYCTGKHTHIPHGVVEEVEEEEKKQEVEYVVNEEGMIVEEIIME